jgi:hypothetical protein
MADTKVKVSKSQLGRMLDIVKTPNANPAKLKTAFLSVTGEDLRSAGWTVDELRDALTAYENGDADEAPAAAAPKGRSRRPAPEPEPEPDDFDEDGDEDSGDDEDLGDDEDDVDGSSAGYEDDEEDEPAPPRRSKAKAPPAKPARSAAQIAATERMRAASAAKAEGKGGTKAPPRPVKVIQTDPVKLLKQLKAEDSERWDKVKEILEVSDRGRPLRVRIRTKVPVTGDPRKDEYSAKGTRDIYTQDMFQVHYSVEDAKKARALRKPAKAAPARQERKAGTGGKDRAAASTGTVKGNRPAAGKDRSNGGQRRANQRRG